MPSQTLLGGFSSARLDERPRLRTPRPTATSEEPVDEGLGGRAAGRHVGTRGGEQGVGVAAVAAVGLGAAVLDPVAHHRLGGLGVELRPDRAVAADQLRADLVAGEDVEAVGRREHVVVPLHPRPGGDRRSVDGDGDPPDLRRRRPADRAAEGVGQHLGAEADPEQRDAALDDVAHQRRLGLDERGGLRAVDVPLRAQRQHELDAVERRPVGGVLALALGEREAAARATGSRRTRRRSRRRSRSAPRAPPRRYRPAPIRVLRCIGVLRAGRASHETLRWAWQ